MATGTNSINVLWLEQAIVSLNLKTLVEKLEVNLTSKAHETYSLILDLRDKGFVVFVLAGDELCNEIFTVSFSNGLRLRIKNISQIIMILLHGWPNLNVRDHVDT